MRVPLSSSSGKAMFATAVALSTVLYVFAAQRHLRAELWGNGVDSASLERAVTLEPANAYFHYKLGRQLLFSDQNATAALPHLQRATELNPGIPWYWLDRAAAHQISGDVEGYRRAVEHAVVADPRTPAVAWEAGNLWLADGDLQRALPFFRTVIENDVLAQKRAFSICWRATHNLDLITRSLVPPTSAAHLALISVLTDEQQTDGAMSVWQHATQMGQTISAHDAYPFVTYLLFAHEPEKAAQVWRDLATFTPELLPRVPAGELAIVNPGFEEDLQSGGLNWWIEPAPGITMQIDTSEFHSGSRSLRIEFPGPEFQLAGLTQYVPVTPGKHYEFSAWVKAQNIESTSGPQFYINDGFDHHQIALGNEYRGSNVWREEKIDFTAGPQTRMVAIRIIRS